MVNEAFREIPGISVDKFDANSHRAQVFFLTHCHRDHFPSPQYGGQAFLKYLTEERKYMYTSELTALILKNEYDNAITENVRVIKPNNPIDVAINHDGDTTIITVTAIPAGHCPGSIMFLFQCANDRNILHTGDFRISPTDLPRFKQLRNGDDEKLDIDCLYLDTTFYSLQYEHFPKRSESISAMCKVITDWINKGDNHVILIKKPAGYGSEGIFVDINKKLGMPICVTEEFLNIYRRIPEFDNAFTLDNINSKIFVEKITRPGVTVCTLQPSAMAWKNWKTGDELCKHYFYGDKHYFKVCYSSHCSRHELMEFIRYMRPRKIVPFVVPDNENEAEIIRSDLRRICDNIFKKAPLTIKRDIEPISPKKMRKCHKRFLNSFKSNQEQALSRSKSVKF